MSVDRKFNVFQSIAIIAVFYFALIILGLLLYSAISDAHPRLTRDHYVKYLIPDVHYSKSYWRTHLMSKRAAYAMLAEYERRGWRAWVMRVGDAQRVAENEVEHNFRNPLPPPEDAP